MTNRRRFIYFLGIGSSAALVNIGIVLYLAHFWNINPLIANILGFFIAFLVSFLGHKYLTFAQLHNLKTLSLPHFFFVACSGGVINEALYYLILRYTSVHYGPALVLTLGLIAVYNFVLSRFWACR